MCFLCEGYVDNVFSFTQEYSFSNSVLRHFVHFVLGGHYETLHGRNTLHVWQSLIKRRSADVMTLLTNFQQLELKRKLLEELLC